MARSASDASKTLEGGTGVGQPEEPIRKENQHHLKAVEDEEARFVLIGWEFIGHDEARAKEDEKADAPQIRVVLPDAIDHAAQR